MSCVLYAIFDKNKKNVQQIFKLIHSAKLIDSEYSLNFKI